MIRGKSEAETCQLNAWAPGTVLVGDEGFGEEKIKITAIGERLILAKRVQDRRGNIVDGDESLWTLTLREWNRDPSEPTMVSFQESMNKYYGENLRQ